MNDTLGNSNKYLWNLIQQWTLRALLIHNPIYWSYWYLQHLGHQSMHRSNTFHKIFSCGYWILWEIIKWLLVYPFRDFFAVGEGILNHYFWPPWHFQWCQSPRANHFANTYANHPPIRPSSWLTTTYQQVYYHPLLFYRPSSSISQFIIVYHDFSF